MRISDAEQLQLRLRRPGVTDGTRSPILPRARRHSPWQTRHPAMTAVTKTLTNLTVCEFPHIVQAGGTTQLGDELPAVVCLAPTFLPPLHPSLSAIPTTRRTHLCRSAGSLRCNGHDVVATWQTHVCRTTGPRNRVVPTSGAGVGEGGCRS